MLKYSHLSSFIRRPILGIFRQANQLEVKSSRTLEFKNPQGNRWNATKTTAQISPDGLKASNDTIGWMHNVFAVEGFDISVGQSQKDQSLSCRSPILYYFEVCYLASPLRVFYIGLSNGNLPNGSPLPFCWQDKNTYGFSNGHDAYFFDGNRRVVKWPKEAKRPEWNGIGDVIGCGILMDSKKGMSIFFTGNGILMGKQIPLSYTGDYLIPTLSISNISVEANFGHDQAKPFKYDVQKCPGLEFN